MQTVLVANRTRVKEILHFAFFLLVVSLTPSIKIFLSFSPVPLVVQNIVFLSYAAVYGKKRGVLLAGAYIIEGLLGLPIFVAANSGLTLLMSPTAGYILGYVVSSYLVGYLFEKKKENSFFIRFSYLLIGAMLIDFLGMLFLSVYIGWKMAFFLGAMPFILGDLIKVYIASFLLPRVRK